MKKYLSAYRSRPDVKDRGREYRRKYRQTEKYKEYRKKYEKSEACIEAKRRYAKSEANKLRQRQYEKERRKSDPIFKLGVNMRRRFIHALKGTVKQSSVLKLIGCSLEELKKHLESQFIEGMTWGNWGLKGWHVDHIKPLNLFDPNDPEQMKKAWHYSNLRPLWAKENHSRPKKSIESRNI